LTERAALSMTPYSAESPYIESQNRISSTKDEKMSVTGWRGCAQ